MTERELLRRLRGRLPAAGRGLVAGIGDDCAIVRQPGTSEDLLYTTDLLIEDVHFRRDTYPARAIGRKALARGLSDIAAMGGDPRYCLVSLALPAWAGSRWVNGFYQGLLGLAAETRTSLVGGDFSRASQLVCDVVVCGTVPRGQALRREGARPGDALYVSGVLGGSRLGLRTQKGAARRLHLNPEPRLKLGRGLRRRRDVTAAMDLSDGLSLDLYRLCEASGVAANIDRPLPVFPGATLDDALHGGEDYELLFTARPGSRVAGRWGGVPLTRIGVIVEGHPGAMKLFGWKLAPGGWDHFQKHGSG